MSSGIKGVVRTLETTGSQKNEIFIKRCSSDNFPSTLFFHEQNNSVAFPPGLSFLGRKDRVDTDEGLRGNAVSI